MKWFLHAYLCYLFAGIGNDVYVYLYIYTQIDTEYIIGWNMYIIHPMHVLAMMMYPYADKS